MLLIDSMARIHQSDVASNSSSKWPNARVHYNDESIENMSFESDEEGEEEEEAIYGGDREIILVALSVMHK
ncbi:hypothetical protein DEO72_LG8g3015 [Vigna unguiculata]|uniref:Uncharacterized protein n=1 Tax=Vigna unguiculata TaxID=3917 RepID=A0A4D6MU80_VIGUN|nr:hypothetical protein DEO72_LG8g3015 [Vigna unguiculata]